MKALVEQAVLVQSPLLVPRTGKRLLVVRAAVVGATADSFLAYCTEGDLVYRVPGTGSFDKFLFDLGPNVECIQTPADIHGASITPCDVVVRPPLVPCSQTIQAVFDAQFLSIAA